MKQKLKDKWTQLYNYLDKNPGMIVAGAIIIVLVMFTAVLTVKYLEASSHNGWFSPNPPSSTTVVTSTAAPDIEYEEAPSQGYSNSQNGRLTDSNPVSTYSNPGYESSYVDTTPSVSSDTSMSVTTSDSTVTTGTPQQSVTPEDTPQDTQPAQPDTSQGTDTTSTVYPSSNSTPAATMDAQPSQIQNTVTNQ